MTKKERIDVLTGPFKAFLALELSAGILLALATAAALVWANSPFHESYHSLWQVKLGLSFGSGILVEKTLSHWINDGLMSIFFFLVGLEIKREFVGGELADPKRAALPIAGALGGFLVPAAIYALFNFGKPGQHGWGIPMATDIAFALGVATLLGKRVPLALKVFLAALAIIDDLGAVLVIALFYTEKLSVEALLFGNFLVGISFLLNWLGVRNFIAFAFIGFVAWAAFLTSGIHATIAGVLLAMTIPARQKLQKEGFLEGGRQLMDDFEKAKREPHDQFVTPDEESALNSLETMIEHIQTPLKRLEHILHPWVAYLILPIFAFANAGITLRGDVLSTLVEPVALGIIFGLVFGKQIGITLFAWLAVRLGFAQLPRGTNWTQIYGLSLLAGIGFTMSLFINGLAFKDPHLMDVAKLAILVASLIAGSAGYLILRKANTQGAFE